MCEAKPFLHMDSLLPLSFSYIHWYINYAKTNYGQVHIKRIVFDKDRHYHTKENFRSCNVLNICKLHLLNTSIFMHKTETWIGPVAFHTTFKIPSHSYPIRFSSVNSRKRKTKICKCRFRISVRGPAIWKNFVANTQKELESSSLIKTKVKTELLDLKNKVTFL